MSKKNIGLYPIDKSIIPVKEDVIIVEKKENTLLYRDKEFGALGLLPASRFLLKEELEKVEVNSEVTIYRYFNASGKRMFAYHVRYEK